MDTGSMLSVFMKKTFLKEIRPSMSKCPVVGPLNTCLCIVSRSFDRHTIQSRKMQQLPVTSATNFVMLLWRVFAQCL
jgi:hypothetical protein